MTHRGSSVGYPESTMRKELKTAVLGLYTYAEFAALAAAFYPVMGVSNLVHRRDTTPRIGGRWMRRFGKLTSSVCPMWGFSVQGHAPADVHDRAYVVVANHESSADPFLLSHLPWDMRWIAKAELYDLPIIGSMMRWSGDLPLRRGDRSSALAMMNEAQRTLENGLSIMMFPEGTRSTDGSLLPFKPGAFELALATGTPILPIAIAGTRACRPKGSRWFGEARAIAKVLPPIAVEGLKTSDAMRLADRTRTVIAAALPELRDQTERAIVAERARFAYPHMGATLGATASA